MTLNLEIYDIIEALNLEIWKNYCDVKGSHLFKHRKNCECCHHHSLFKGHNVNEC